MGITIEIVTCSPRHRETVQTDLAYTQNPGARPDEAQLALSQSHRAPLAAVKAYRSAFLAWMRRTGDASRRKSQHGLNAGPAQHVDQFMIMSSKSLVRPK
jgi:hypothetical protein